MPPPTPENEAIAAVQAYCGWIIAPSTIEDVVFDATCSTVLRLPTLYLTALNSLTIDGVTIDVADTTQVEWSQSGYLRRSAGFGTLLRGVAVNMTHGYVDFPGDIWAVIERVTARSQTNAEQLVQVGQVRLATGPDGAPLGTSLTEGDRAVLSHYRLPPRP